MAFGNNIVCLPCLSADRWERSEYTSYFPLIIFFLAKWYQYFIIFQGFSDNLMLCDKLFNEAMIK